MSDSVTPWTVTCQAPLSVGFSRQAYCSGLPLPSPGDLPNPGIDARSPLSQADSLPSKPPRKHHQSSHSVMCCTSVHFRQGETLPTSRLSQCDVTWVLRGPGQRRGAHLFWTMLMANTPHLSRDVTWVLRGPGPEAGCSPVLDHAHGQHPPPLPRCHMGAEGPRPGGRALTCSGPCSWPTPPLSQYDVTWVLRGPGPEAGPLTCSGPCSWPPSPQGTHSSQ